MAHSLKIVEIEKVSDIQSIDYPQFIKLYTSYCNPCKTLSKNLENTVFNREMTLYSLNVENNEQIKKHLKLMGVPAFLKIEKKNEIHPENVKNLNTVEKFCEFVKLEIVEESEEIKFDDSDF